MDGTLQLFNILVMFTTGVVTHPPADSHAAEAPHHQHTAGEAPPAAGCESCLKYLAAIFVSS